MADTRSCRVVHARSAGAECALHHCLVMTCVCWTLLLAVRDRVTWSCWWRAQFVKAPNSRSGTVFSHSSVSNWQDSDSPGRLIFHRSRSAFLVRRLHCDPCSTMSSKSLSQEASTHSVLGNIFFQDRRCPLTPLPDRLAVHLHIHYSLFLTLYLPLPDNPSPVSPTVWNSLPCDVQSSPSQASFKRRLETHLFDITFNEQPGQLCCVTTTATQNQRNLARYKLLVEYYYYCYYYFCTSVTIIPREF